MPLIHDIRAINKTGNEISEHRLLDPGVRKSFRSAKTWICAYAALSVISLITAAFLLQGETVGYAVGVWIRCGVVTASAVLMYVLTVLAEKGNRWAYGRLRIVVGVAQVGFLLLAFSPDYPLGVRLEQMVCGLLVAVISQKIKNKRLKPLFAKADAGR